MPQKFGNILPHFGGLIPVRRVSLMEFSIPAPSVIDFSVDESFARMPRSCFALLAILLVAPSLCTAAEDIAPVKSWLATRQRLRWPEYITATTFAAECHSLKLDVITGEVGRGGILRVLCSIERVKGHGEKLVNPFATRSFPRSVALVIYDSKGQFVQSLPRDAKASVNVDDDTLVALKHREMRGKIVEIELSRQSEVGSEMSLSLQPGMYQLQLVACRRFFSGGWIAYAHDKGVKVAEIADGEAEEKRSNIVRFTVPEDAPRRMPQADETDHLIAVCLKTLDSSRHQPKPNTIVDCILTVQNLSRTRSIGLIDPFSAAPREYIHPVRWVLEIDGARFDTNDLSPRYPFRPRRSDFLIRPPGGLAGGLVGAIPSDAANYKLSVDINKGLVIDDAKLEVLRAGDPEVGWTAGGVDPSVISPDSKVTLELQRKR